MDYARHLEAVERETDRLVEVAAAGAVDRRVPTCPDFDLTDLLGHIGEFCGFWTHVVCEALDRPKTPFPDRPDRDGIVGWVDELRGHLVSVLGEASADTPCWTWYDADQSVGFVARRCAHELAIHRVDVEATRGPVTPVEPELAADGIEEIFLMLSIGGPDGIRGQPGSGETLHLHGTDHQPAEWLLTLGPDSVEVEREHAKGDLALRGSVSDLEMLLYQRPTTGNVERFGDVSVLDVFHGEFTFG